MVRWVRRLALLLVAAVVLYGAVTAGQVWLASRRDEAAPADGIVVLGAAQYSGRPSPDLAARLDHALTLYQRHLAPVVAVTGGRVPGDAFTEAGVSATYLRDHGVPDSAIVEESTGRDSWQSLAAAAGLLKARGVRRVLLVSDPFHSARIVAIAGELGLDGRASPTRTSPIRGVTAAPYYAKETFAMAVGRVVGFDRLAGISARVTRVREAPASR